MSNDQVPAVDTAIESIVGALKEMRVAGATADQLLGYTKSKLLNPKMVYQKDRNVVLKKINHGMGTNWSMSKVKSSDATPYIKEEKKSAPIPVDELHGSSAVAASGNQPLTVAKGEDVVLGKAKPAKLEQESPVEPSVVEKSKGSGLQTDAPDVIQSTPSTPTTQFSGLEALVPAPQEFSVDTSATTVDDNTVNDWISKNTPNLQGEQELAAVSDDVAAGNIAAAEGNDDDLIRPTHHTPLDMDLIPPPAAIPGEAKWPNEQAPTAAAPQANAAAVQQPNANTTTSAEGNTMNTSTTNTATNTTNTSDAAANVTRLAELNDFIGLMTLRGANSPELRAHAFHFFLDSHESAKYRPAFEAHTATLKPEVSVDERLFTFLDADANKDFAQAFMTWVIGTYTPAGVVGATASSGTKTRFSLMGERDEGIRGSWIAAGAAVIGGGLEMTASGGLTAGSAIGTVVGAAAAFFAGEMVDENIDSDFGRYVVAGTLGLGLGAVGSTLGRSMLPGANLLGESTTPAAESLIEINPTVASSFGILAGM